MYKSEGIATLYTKAYLKTQKFDIDIVDSQKICILNKDSD